MVGSSARSAVALAVAVLIGAAALLGGCGSSKQQASGVRGGSEVVAAPISTPGNNPFTASVGTDRSGVSPPPGATSSTGSAVSYNAGLPGLYGGTRNQKSCDAEKLVSFLEQNPAKGAAWASVLGIQPSQIRSYVAELTSVILRTDTRVTNHGYVNGRATPIQTVLQAGTAVFVDKYGQPVVKCYCGNPLTPPVLYASPVYVGTTWPGFSATHITIINRSTTIIDPYTLWDPNNGKLFPRTPGQQGHDGPYAGTPQPGPPSTTTTGTTSTAPAPPSESPSVSTEPYSVYQGQSIVISVRGFAPGASLTVTISGAAHAQDSMTAGGDGTGTYMLDTSDLPPGQYYVNVANTATGANSNNVFVVYPAQTTSTPTQTTSTPTETTATSTDTTDTLTPGEP